MRFYNREKELGVLHNTEELSLQIAQMTFVVGRRRIGKTSLLIEAYKERTFLYFFVARKTEVLLCAEFMEEIKLKLEIPIFGTIKTFKELFGFLMELAKTRPFTLVIDEFQEFYNVNPSVFSDIQHIWDSNKETSKINLVLCGSIYSMMTQIFENSKEPLFGRATQRIYLKAFDVTTLKVILSDHYPDYTSEDMLAFYLFTGGVAKYVEALVQKKAFTFFAILEEVVAENSLFLDEGKNVLIEEFGKDYGNYFSILSLIASGKTSRVEIESIMEIQTGGFIDRLEKDFGIIKKIRPILSKPNSRSVKYAIEDNFLSFWFRFIYKHRSAVEIGNYVYIKEVIKRDYETYSGHILEKYFVEKLKLENKYNTIGSYWERGNLNEIDIVAINDLKKQALFVEVKRNKSNISIEKLKRKSELLIQKNLKNFTLEFKGYSLEDI